MFYILRFRVQDHLFSICNILDGGRYLQHFGAQIFHVHKITTLWALNLSFAQQHFATACTRLQYLHVYSSTTSTAQRRWRKFQRQETFSRAKLLGFTDSRANPQTGPKEVEALSLSLSPSLCIFISLSLFISPSLSLPLSPSFSLALSLSLSLSFSGQGIIRARKTRSHVHAGPFLST